jgi:hypothetical protein
MPGFRSRMGDELRVAMPRLIYFIADLDINRLKVTTRKTKNAGASGR